MLIGIFASLAEARALRRAEVEAIRVERCAIEHSSDKAADDEEELHEEAVEHV